MLPPARNAPQTAFQEVDFGPLMQVATATGPSNAHVVLLTFWLRAQDRHAFASRIVIAEPGQICLAFLTHQSDESSCARQAQKRMSRTHMTNAETNGTAA